MKTQLTIEESARLIELGVDASLASKCSAAVQTFAGCRGITKLPVSRPIFDLSDLLSILPKEIDSNVFNLLATGYDEETESLEKGWSATYIDEQCIPSFGKDAIFSAPELIDALNQLAIWCLENGHLKNEKK